MVSVACLDSIYRPADNCFASVRRYAVDTFMVIYVPVLTSKTRFFWILARNVRRVARLEWLRLLPVEPFLPVIEHILDMSWRSVQMRLQEVKGK